MNACETPPLRVDDAKRQKALTTDASAIWQKSSDIITSQTELHEPRTAFVVSPKTSVMFSTG